MVKEGRESDISVLGDGLLVEILCRLGSAKYATQCKSVCKLWCSLVNPEDDSYWLRRWYQINNKNSEGVTLITHHSLDIYTETSTVLDFLPNPVQVVGSHKDLLLCCSSCDDLCSGYYICNTITKQWTALPPPPPEKFIYPSIRVGAKVEFIVDERADGGLKFTVVRIIPYRILSSREEKVQVSIFSSDRGWREVDVGGGRREMFLSCRKIVPYKGSLVLLIELPEEDRLYSWDLHSNYTRLPPVYSDNIFASMFTIGVCEGRLRMARLSDDRQKVIVWQFDDSQRHGWDMLQELDLVFSQLLIEDSTTECEQVLQMAFLPHDGDMLYMLASYETLTTWPSSHIFMYDLKRRRLELMRKLPEYISKGFKLFPLVKNCWPTPVPCLDQ